MGIHEFMQQGMGTDPFLIYLNDRLPLTPEFIDSIEPLHQAMHANPFLHAIVEGQYPDPRSLVN